MSLTAIRPYFKARCEAIGYREYAEAFNADGVGRAALDKRFMIVMGEAQPQQVSPREMTILMDVTVRLYFKTGRSTVERVETAVEDAEKLIKDAMKTTNRIGSTVRDVRFNSLSIEPTDLENDNSVEAVVGFSALVYMTLE